MTVEHEQQLQQSTSNWLKVSDIIYSEAITEDMILALLAYELDNRKRPYVVKRIYSRFSEIRRRRERVEIDICVNSL